MSIFDKIKGIVFEAEPTSIDPNQPISNQINKAQGAVLVQPTYIQSPQSAYTVPVSMQGLSQEDSVKWEKYFQDFFEKLNDPKPSYHEFIAMADAMGNALPEPQKFAGCFAGFKIQGLTRDALLTTAQNTLKAIQENGEKFQNTINAKRQDDVTSKLNLITEKQAKMAKLNQEITQLTIDAQQAEQKLNTSVLGYNTYSDMLLAKINRDIQSIGNYIVS